MPRLKPKAFDLDKIVWATWNRRSHAYNHEMTPADMKHELLLDGNLPPEYGLADIETSMHKLFDL